MKKLLIILSAVAMLFTGAFTVNAAVKWETKDGKTFCTLTYKNDSATQMFVIGTFTENWKEPGWQMEKNAEGLWEITFEMLRPKEFYKFFDPNLDGDKYIEDPEAPDTIANPFGSKNGILRKPKDDGAAASMSAKQNAKDKKASRMKLQKKESAAKQKKMELEERQREIQAEAEKNHQPQESHLKYAADAAGMVKLNKGGKPYMIVCDHEVTQSEYESVMGYNPSYNKADGNLPVEMVSWYDAVKYCNKRSETEGLTPCYVIKGNNVTWNRAADGYRLPTVDEYKDAAGLSDGNNANDDNAWTLNNSDNKTHVVKQKKANINNLYDMTGNVAEWCWSDNKSNKSYNVGAWNVPDINAGNINEQPAINKNPTLGFRVVRNADAGDIAALKYAEEEQRNQEKLLEQQEQERKAQERIAEKQRREEEYRSKQMREKREREQRIERNRELRKDYNTGFYIWLSCTIAHSALFVVTFPTGIGLVCGGGNSNFGCVFAGAFFITIAAPCFFLIPGFAYETYKNYKNSPAYYKRKHSIRPTRNERVIAGLIKTTVLMGYDYREDKACVGMSIKI